MQDTIIPPHESGHDPIHPPMVYVEQPLKWEYKQIARDLESEKPLGEAELNVLGEAGWEMSGVAQHESRTYYYFKRQVEK
jgi:hypothetical protein